MNSTNNIPGPHIDDDLKWKAKIFMAFIFCLFTVLLLRLLNMQVFKGSYYEGLARNNRIRIISIPAQRGQILDRNLEVLADNRPAYNLMVMPEDVSDVSSIAGRLAEILECEEAEIIEKIKEGKKRPYNPVALARDISFYQMASIETQLYTMPGVSIDATSERDYVLKELSAHALGFLGEISRRQLEAFGPKSPYAPGDLIGKSGVESICEETLRGTKGVRIFEVDALGRKIHVLDERAPVPGKDVVLTIDKRLQLAACRSLGGRAGAVVAIGNAPTALFRLLELIDEGAPVPAAVLGGPVGFVGSAQSKEELIERPRGMGYLVVTGRRGGSAMAAAAVNAIASEQE